MFDANAFIEQAGQEIADLKRRSKVLQAGLLRDDCNRAGLGDYGLDKGICSFAGPKKPDPFVNVFRRIGVFLWNLLGGFASARANSSAASTARTISDVHHAR
jgi:hypothetical protein